MFFYFFFNARIRIQKVQYPLPKTYLFNPFFCAYWPLTLWTYSYFRLAGEIFGFHPIMQGSTEWH